MNRPKRSGAAPLLVLLAAGFLSAATASMPDRPSAANRTAVARLRELSRQSEEWRGLAREALVALKDFPDRMERLDADTSEDASALVRSFGNLLEDVRKPTGRPFAGLRADVEKLEAGRSGLEAKRMRLRNDFDAAESRFRDAARGFRSVKGEADGIRKDNIRDHVVLNAYQKGRFEQSASDLEGWERSVAELNGRFGKHDKSCGDVLRKADGIRREIVKAFGGPGAVLSETCPVSFVSDDGTPLGLKTVAAGAPVGDPELPVPAKKFHRFAGWRRSGTGETFGTDGVAGVRTPRTGAPVEFRAEFEEVPARVEFRVSEDAEPHFVVSAYLRSAGKPVQEPPAPEAPWGKDFVGWTVGGEPYGFDRPLEDEVVRIVASWKDSRFPVRFSGAEGEKGEKDRTLSLQLADGLPGDIRPARARAHYDFSGWARRPDASGPDLPAGGKDSGKTLGNLVAEGARELVLHPVWSPTRYDVRFFSRTAGSAEPSECGSAKGSVEEPVAKPADPKAIPGRKFAGWFAEGASSGYDFSSPLEGDLRLVARWDTVTNEAAFLRRDGKTVLVRLRGSADDPVEPPPGESVEGDGWRFLRWSVSKDGPAWDGPGKPLLADVRLFPVCEYQEIPVVVDRSAEYAVETNLVPYGCTLARPREPESFSGSSRFAGWNRKGDDGGQSYDFSAPVKEPFVLEAVWSATLVPEPDDGRPAPAFRPAKSVPVPAAAVDTVRWLDGKGVSPLLARILVGVLFFFLVLEAAVILRGR